ncbi:hypothetical protein ABZS66_43590 [Dactylosporangium sp. NPDC005572]|uniref:hypothetical protein n=1 Tax=Dactylosporangium sp. NPDC005572 TaxID=3156889 RepID=UPI0033AC29C5
MNVAHIPGRPTWLCTGCGDPWPCAAKRHQLLAEYGESHAELRTMMALRVADAAEDLRQLGAEQLWGRFLGWLPAPGQGPVIRWVANPPLGGHRRPANEAAVTTLPAPPAGSGPTRTPPPRRSRRGTR